MKPLGNDANLNYNFDPQAHREIFPLPPRESIAFPLHVAASKGWDAECLHLLDVEQIPVDTLDADGMTPLTKAARAGHLKACEILLNHGANVEGNPSYLTPLFEATLKGHFEVCGLLLESGASIGKRFLGMGALTRAKLNYHKEVIDLLKSFAPSEELELEREVFLRKALAHAFQIGEESAVESTEGQNLNVELEGAESPYFFHQFAKNFSGFAAIFQMSRPLLKEQIIAACDGASGLEDAEAKFKRWELDNPIIIVSRSERHVRTFLFWKNYFVACDRSGASNSLLSATFNRSKLTVEVLKGLETFEHVEGLHEKIYENILINLSKYLGFKSTLVNLFLERLHLPFQRVGNCSYANSEGVFLPLLVLGAFYDTGLNLEDMQKEFLDQIMRDTRIYDVYMNWMVFQRLFLAEKYLTNWSKPHDFLPDEQLLSDIVGGLKTYAFFVHPQIAERCLQAVEGFEAILNKP